MATKLGIFNEALRSLGERRIVDLTENTKERNTLEQIWNLDDVAFGLVRRCLEEGLWNFAMRTQKLGNDSDIEPPFGWRFAFSQPADFVRLNQISLDETFNDPLLNYEDENHVWYLDHDEVYVKYVSDHTDYGFNLGNFPGTFTKFVSMMAADEAASTLAPSEMDNAMKRLKRAKTNARSKDAMNDPTKFPPAGSWERARTRSGHSAQHDGGSRNRLTG